MNALSFSQLLPVLQVAVGPVILVSGVSLLLLVLTNRLGRAVDRARQLNQELRTAVAENRQAISDQIETLFRRARLIRASIALGGTSLLFAAILVITLFIAVLWQWEVGLLVVILFIGCMLSLIASLLTFLLDLQWALEALRVELDRERNSVKLRH